MNEHPVRRHRCSLHLDREPILAPCRSLLGLASFPLIRGIRSSHCSGRGLWFRGSHRGSLDRRRLSLEHRRAPHPTGAVDARRATSLGQGVLVPYLARPVVVLEERIVGEHTEPMVRYGGLRAA